MAAADLVVGSDAVDVERDVGDVDMMGEVHDSAAQG